MNWLVTGGCGFLGTNLVRDLHREARHTIRIVDNLSVGTRDALREVAAYEEIPPDEVASARGGVQLVVADICDAAIAQQITQDVDVIVHLAANTGVAPSVEDPRTDCLTNVLGTFNYLEAARVNGVRRFVFASSGAPVGAVQPPIHEEIAPHPVSPYGASKLAGEGYCSAYWGSFGIETVVLRFGNVYGPGSTHKGSVVAKFLKDALASRKLEIYGDGSQTRDFIYVDDLIRAVELAATKPALGGETFQIATNSETTVGELAERTQSVLRGLGVEDVSIAYADPRVGDVKRNFSDTRKAKEILGWTPHYDLDRGLQATAEFFLNANRMENRSP